MHLKVTLLSANLLQVDILVNNAGLALGKAPVHENNMEVGKPSHLQE